MNKCPCCGFFTFSDDYPGSYDICPVCYWEDDEIQLDDPTYAGGANKICLNDARKNYKLFGACSKDVIERVRLPNKVEMTKGD